VHKINWIAIRIVNPEFSVAIFWPGLHFTRGSGLLENPLKRLHIVHFEPEMVEARLSLQFWRLLDQSKIHISVRKVERLRDAFYLLRPEGAFVKACQLFLV